ncbi:MAG: type II secretion system F family protein [Planctomycetota bacterium]|nr:type II secretion system F family protein [Planctomycetota bacterium]
MNRPQQPPPPPPASNRLPEGQRVRLSLSGLALGSRISARRLAQFCHNLGNSLHAGVDLRRILETEAESGTPRHRRLLKKIRDQVGAGISLTESFAQTGGYFPPLARAMVEVGESTGRLERIFRRLATYYDTVAKAQRDFIAAIAWPVFELLLAIMVIGAFILLLGMVWQGQGEPPITFLGLYGVEGFFWYALVVGSLLTILIGLAIAIRYRVLKLEPILRVLILIPGLGKGLRTIALSRLCWSLAMASNSEMNPRRILALAVTTTQNGYYTRHLAAMQQSVQNGRTLLNAFQDTGCYPRDFLDVLSVGERAGTVSESMETLAVQYDEKMQHFFKALAVAGGFLVFLIVAGLLIVVILMLAIQYTNLTNSLSL